MPGSGGCHESTGLGKLELHELLQLVGVFQVELQHGGLAVTGVADLSQRLTGLCEQRNGGFETVEKLVAEGSPSFKQCVISDFCFIACRFVRLA